MTLLSDLVSAIGAGSIEVYDLTAPLSATTPILGLPEQFGQTWPFALTEISRYDDRGPGWYWNNISTGEHTGTHFDAPVQGVGVETVGTDAGAAHSSALPSPCHSHVLGADKDGLTQLKSLRNRPPTGAVAIASPLPIVTG